VLVVHDGCEVLTDVPIELSATSDQLPATS
jgi:hypothetical protein